MLGIYKGRPAIYCPDTGVCVIAYARTSWGCSKAVALAKELRETRS